MLVDQKVKQDPGVEGLAMNSTIGIMMEKERILQGFVSIGRSILHGSVENIAIRSDALFELKSLVEKADRIGVHGMAFSSIDPIEESTGLAYKTRKKCKG